MTSKLIGFFQSIANKADSVLTTKGDLATYSTTRIREAVGTNNKTLMADSAQATGIKWGASATSTLTTAGDLLVASGANALTRLARGSDNQTLMMNGTSLNWETVSAGSTWELLDQHDVANDATEDDYTFTPASALDLIDSGDYNALYVVGKGRSSATCNMQIILNGLSEFNTQYTLCTSGTISGATDLSASEIDVVPISLMNGARPFSFGMWIVQKYASATHENLSWWGFGDCGNNRGYCTFSGGSVNQSDASITSLKFQVSDSTTYTGVQFAIYGIKQ